MGATRQPCNRREMALKSTKEDSPWEKVINARNVEKFTGELTERAAAGKKALRKKRKSNLSLLNHSFFNRNTLTVARDLLGKRLVRCIQGQRLSGMVVETEAYLGANDSASHAFRGQTQRNAVMFGPAGMAYVYLVYGMHHMLNVTTEAQWNSWSRAAACRGTPGGHRQDDRITRRFRSGFSRWPGKAVPGAGGRSLPERSGRDPW